MPRYEAWVPCYASARVVVETEQPVTDPEELRRLIIEEGEMAGGICHQCGGDFSIDGMMDDNQMDDLEVFEV